MGTLYVVATPIGNLEDITIRAIRTLFSVSVIVCEDTRRTGILLALLRKRYEDLAQHVTEPQLMRYDDRTEHAVAPHILDILKQGTSVAFVSDAGTPLICDPGYVLVKEVRKRGIPVRSIPGPSALLTALTSSGLPTDTFTFLGYPPEKQSHRLKLFGQLPSVNPGKGLTYVLYCAPHKLRSTLVDIKSVLRNIDIVICRELTKIHEEQWRGNLSEALAHFAVPKGEFVLLFHLPARNT